MDSRRETATFIPFDCDDCLIAVRAVMLFSDTYRVDIKTVENWPPVGIGCKTVTLNPFGANSTMRLQWLCAEFCVASRTMRRVPLLPHYFFMVDTWTNLGSSFPRRMMHRDSLCTISDRIEYTGSRIHGACGNVSYDGGKINDPGHTFRPSASVRYSDKILNWRLITTASYFSLFFIVSGIERG